MHNDVRHVIAGFFTGRHLVVLLIFAAAFVCLLVGPVLNDVMLTSVSGPANKAAPFIFILGLLVLFTGILTRAGVLDAVGAGMMGLVLLAGLLVHY
jgi:hypothetical protein